VQAEHADDNVYLIVTSRTIGTSSDGSLNPAIASYASGSKPANVECWARCPMASYSEPSGVSPSGALRAPAESLENSIGASGMTPA
jgi:hypothetical protein